MNYEQIVEMVKKVRKACAEELKGKQHKLDMNKNGKLDAQDFEHLRKMKKEEVDLDEAVAVAVTTKPGISVKKEPGRTRAISTHHVVDGQHYKVTSQHDGDDGLYHDIHKVSGKKENRVHTSYKYGVGGYDSPSKPERSGTLDKKVASSLYSAHDRERKKKVHGDEGKHPHELHDDLDESLSNRDLAESSFEKELKDLQRRRKEYQRSINMGHYGSIDGTGISNKEYEKRVKELQHRYNKFQTNINMYGHLGESVEEDIELTLEDIEYIMESEDFQQLDELSKNTLTSYVQKAKADRATKQTKKSELEGARSMLNQLSAGAKGGGTQHSAGSFRATGPQYERPDVGVNIKKHMPAMHKQLVKMHQKLQADRVETNRVIKKRDTGIAGAKDRMERMNAKTYRNEEVDLDEASFEGSNHPFSPNYKSKAFGDDQKTSTKTYHNVKKTSTGTVYTKQFDSEGTSKGTGEDAAKAAEPPVKRGRGRPVGSKSGARQAGSASKTDYRGFVTHTLNLPASK